VTPPWAPIPGLVVESKRRARLPILAASYTLSRLCRISPARATSPAIHPAFACSPVKGWLLSMLTHGCGAACGPLTGSARYGSGKAGGGAGTGVLNRTLERIFTGKRLGLKIVQLRGLLCHLCALPGSQLHGPRAVTRKPSHRPQLARAVKISSDLGLLAAHPAPPVYGPAALHRRLQSPLVYAFKRPSACFALLFRFYVIIT